MKYATGLLTMVSLINVLSSSGELNGTNVAELAYDLAWGSAYGTSL